MPLVAGGGGRWFFPEIVHHAPALKTTPGGPSGSIA
jgi:hypothetical protein